MDPTLDTSVVVRYLTDDPPDMAEEAERLIDGGQALSISDVALVETAHVLRTLYGLRREEVLDLLTSFLQKENISVQFLDRGTVITALLLCRPSGRVSIPDALIWAAARQAGAEAIYSFDDRFPAQDVEVRRPGTPAAG